MNNSQTRYTNRLNIFVDETGEFGYSKRSSKLYGISLVLHEQSNCIDDSLTLLQERQRFINFQSMVHMGELVTGHGSFNNMSITERKKIYTQLYRFATSIDAKYHSIILAKRMYDNNKALKNALEKEIQSFILNNLEYFQQFNEIKVYYDGGQKKLSKIINDTFGKLNGYERKEDFDHTEKKLFQVADMLTYVDKLIYKSDNNLKFSKTEECFFDYKTINKTKRELKKHRFQQK